MTATALLAALLLLGDNVPEEVAFTSPGFPPSVMDAKGGLREDWGILTLRLSGDGVAPDAPVSVESTTLDGLIPAARAATDRGAVSATWTAYRAPVFPAGVDVLTLTLAAKPDRPARVTLEVAVPEGVEAGARTARLGGRAVIGFPPVATAARELREWGYADEATALPGWAKPEGACDPAFRNIRAGMGGVPIVYRFAVAPKAAQTVVLGFCESHWDSPGQRPMTAAIEGAPPVVVDPIARWGRHQPGTIAFAGRDNDGDGYLQVAIQPAPGASDRNPILNVIWLFPPGETPTEDQLVKGELSTGALRYVDVGGENDRSLYPPGKIEYTLDLPAGGKSELTFLVAGPGGAVPGPGSAWTPESLRKAALEVWRDWPSK